MFLPVFPLLVKALKLQTLELLEQVLQLRALGRVVVFHARSLQSLAQDLVAHADASRVIRGRKDFALFLGDSVRILLVGAFLFRAHVPSSGQGPALVEPTCCILRQPGTADVEALL